MPALKAEGAWLSNVGPAVGSAAMSALPPDVGYAAWMSATPPDVGYAAGCRLRRLDVGYAAGCRLRRLDVGYAAGCEAGLCPADVVPNLHGATPLVRALPEGFWAKGHTGGVAPISFSKLTAGQSPASHPAA